MTMDLSPLLIVRTALYFRGYQSTSLASIFLPVFEAGPNTEIAEHAPVIITSI